MNLAGKGRARTDVGNSKGEIRGFYILMGIFITLASIVAFNYYHDRNTDFRIHIPKIEVH